MTARRRGFTLFELMLSIGLMGAILVVAEPIGRGAARVLAGETSSAWAEAAIDRTIDGLRHDVWRATAVTAADGHHLELTFADGPPGTRLIGAGGGLPADATVVVAGPVVRLTVPSSPGFRGGRIDLFAATVAAREAR